MENHETILLEARQITKEFPGVKALDQVELRAYAGRVNAIMGENGAGKSTLMNILSGVYTDYEGVLLMDGKELHLTGTEDARGHGIAMIHQELHLVPFLDIAENIFLGREPETALGLIDYKRMHREARQLLDRLHFETDTHTLVNDLRVGQQQMVEIAKAVSVNARVLIMDEPTSSLSESETEVLFQLIQEFRSQGVAILYITHKMDELRQLADYVTIMRDGKYIDELPVKGLDTDHIVAMMVGRDKGDFFVKNSTVYADPFVALEVRGLSLHDNSRKGHDVLHDISLQVKHGEVLGIYGLMGAGRTELLESIFGLHAHEVEYAADGGCFINGQRVTIGSTSDAVAAKMTLIPEDRKRDGLVLDMNIRENTSLASLWQFLTHGLLSPKKEKAAADDYRQRLSIKSHSDQQLTGQLSGGNQQKVVLAKWLLTDPDIILLDEPTRGIDIMAKNDIYRLISELATEGRAVIMVSSELPEIMAVSDRIITLCQGHLRQEFLRKDFSEQAILKSALPQTDNTISYI